MEQRRALMNKLRAAITGASIAARYPMHTNMFRQKGVSALAIKNLGVINTVLRHAQHLIDKRHLCLELFRCDLNKEIKTRLPTVIETELSDAWSGFCSKRNKRKKRNNI